MTARKTAIKNADRLQNYEKWIHRLKCWIKLGAQRQMEAFQNAGYNVQSRRFITRQKFKYIDMIEDRLSRIEEEILIDKSCMEAYDLLKETVKQLPMDETTESSVCNCDSPFDEDMCNSINCKKHASHDSHASNSAFHCKCVKFIIRKKHFCCAPKVMPLVQAAKKK
eukprot:336042_1